MHRNMPQFEAINRVDQAFHQDPNTSFIDFQQQQQQQQRQFYYSTVSSCVEPTPIPITFATKKVMFSPRTYTGVVFCTRIIILILTIAAMVLILTAPGACFSRYLNGQSISREICPGQNSIFPMNADRWSNALHFQGRGQNVYGQVALICVSLAFALITVGVSCLVLATGNILSYPQIFVSAIALIAFLACGGVETWYATGFDHMEFFIQAVGNGVFSGCAGMPGCQIQFVVKGWAVAAAFYFLSALLYIVDMALVFLSKDNPLPPPVIFKGNRRLRSSF